MALQKKESGEKMGKLAVNYNGVSSAQFVSIDVKSTYWPGSGSIQMVL